MRYRLFGTTGLRVSELFFGAMTFSEQGGMGASPEECARMLDIYAEAGGNVIDTAVNYGDGASEDILGKLLAGRRDRFVLSTKYGLSRDGSDPNAAGSHRKNLRLSLETSLRRLGTDYLDIYWVHIWDAHTPLEETMRALDDAVRAGQILHLGISDTPAWVIARANTLAEWHAWTPLAGVQAPYNLLRRDIEREILPLATASGLSVAAWGPLAEGVLSGKFTRPDGQSARGRVRADLVSQAQHAAVQVLQEVAAEASATCAQVAIAWIMARSPAIHPIIGARSGEQLEENLGALAVRLSPEMIGRLEAAVPFEAGFPGDFIDQTRTWVYGEAGTRVIPRG